MTERPRGIRTRGNAEGNQQLAEIIRFPVPSNPLPSPKLAVGLAVAPEHLRPIPSVLADNRHLRRGAPDPLTNGRFRKQRSDSVNVTAPLPDTPQRTIQSMRRGQIGLQEIEESWATRRIAK